ncbi:MAG: glycine cleavage system protein GcvH [Alphaproteobacteria bacterium]|jgi:glycine cleavage system H protein|nr:glycine cleavage system protein GcvH [Alphaproteobacteria bacterium]MDP6590142.1 glycine cleavage system protein GcvH [Alphaproteobacteria bacterium]MDP6817480.1 glycine cleavage system protein GcvH [Alphaproteobacteria bacterium]|tara:strand:+ start:137 stop:514 length:378 start_codon:yes stop_codon:yes gene_type:complete
MSDLKFSQNHEWLRLEGDTATIGISDYAQEQLGDIVYVELPEIGQQIAAGGQAAVVESVKAASEVYSPVGGQVVEVNSALEDDPALVNSDATGEGWFFKLKLDDVAESEAMMDESAYKEFTDGLD